MVCYRCLLFFGNSRVKWTQRNVDITTWNVSNVCQIRRRWTFGSSGGFVRLLLRRQLQNLNAQSCIISASNAMIYICAARYLLTEHTEVNEPLLTTRLEY
jgi:hypothetical protein